MKELEVLQMGFIEIGRVTRWIDEKMAYCSSAIFKKGIPTGWNRSYVLISPSNDLCSETISIKDFALKSFGSNEPDSGSLHSIAAHKMMYYDIFATD